VWAVAIRGLDLYVRLATRLTVRGLDHIPRSGPALLVANHVSYLDPVVLVVVGHRAGRRKTRFVGYREAFEKPVTGWFLRAGRHIPVREGTERVLTIRQARAALDRGDLVLIYPEGTIATAGAVTEAKGGAGLLALSAGVPVIPIATAGLERGAAPWWRRRRATVTVGPPVDLADAPGRGRARYEAASNQCLDAVRALR
jgi:1-acyl-sn-glycerol-3-phosphate acyltransferase